MTTSKPAGASPKTYAMVASAAVATFLGGAFLIAMINAPADRFEACRQGSVSGGDIGGPFTLVDETGATITDAEVLSGASLIYFGYTFCPDVCPLDVDRNAAAIELLEEQGDIVTPIFITVDPERDTPEHLAQFTDYFHPRMIGLGGSKQQVEAAAKAYRVYYKRQASDDDEFYLVDHSTFSYLVLPEIGFVDFYRRELSPEQVAARVSCFVANA